MVFAFNTLYAGVIRNGEPVSTEPIKLVWSEKRDAWYSRKHDLTIEWIGHVSGPISYFSSRDYDEVVEWIQANS